MLCIGFYTNAAANHKQLTSMHKSATSKQQQARIKQDWAASIFKYLRQLHSDAEKLKAFKPYRPRLQAGGHLR